MNMKRKRTEKNKCKKITLATEPMALGALTIHNYSKHYKNDVGDLVDSLAKYSNDAKKGNFESLESMLMIQAHTLNSIFNTLAVKASENVSSSQFEVYLRLAFKAQNQCRVTIETLSHLKNPPSVAFVQQANIGYNQQVNNLGRNLVDTELEQKNKNLQNQLLEENHGEWLDF